MATDFGYSVEKFIKGDFKNIVVCTGAGVSTSAGIPDYRGEDGMYSREPLFTRDYADANPDYETSENWVAFAEGAARALPTATHKFCMRLHEEGRLKRVYTQNIDGLHSKVGLPPSKIVEFHGRLPLSSVVLMGDDIPPAAAQQVVRDLVVDEAADDAPSVDCILVMGTSLQVAPFCAIPNLVGSDCVRFLISTTPEVCFTNPYHAQHSYYGSGYDMPVSPWTTFSGVDAAGEKVKRDVTRRNQWDWDERQPWDQCVVEATCDDWCTAIVNHDNIFEWL